MIAKETTIVAGDVTDDAKVWLEKHGAKIEGVGLLIITLPEKAEVFKGNCGWDYTISFSDVRGDDEQSWLDVELYIDAYETSLRLKYAGDPHCQCRGRGCPKCNEELARIAQGEDPYAHHVAKKKQGEAV